MTNRVDFYIGDDGDYIRPISATADNTSDLVSDRGVYYKAFITDTTVYPIEAGNPMGLLLTLTYPATP